MKVIVSEIPDDGLYIDKEDSFESSEFDGLSKTQTRVRIEKSGSDVIVSGKVSALLNLSCSRCLKDFKREIEFPVNVVYSPSGEITGDHSYELSADELSTAFYLEDEIDLGQMSKEQALLNAPMKPLCKSSCKGICPKCGADLNKENCNCNAERIDHRFQALEKYLKKKKE